jgi:hypothetical protein
VITPRFNPDLPRTHALSPDERKARNLRIEAAALRSRAQRHDIAGDIEAAAADRRRADDKETEARKLLHIFAERETEAAALLRQKPPARIQAYLAE